MNADFFLVRRTLSLLKDHGDGYLSVKITRRWQRTKARNIKRVNVLIVERAGIIQRGRELL